MALKDLMGKTETPEPVTATETPAVMVIRAVTETPAAAATAPAQIAKGTPWSRSA